MKKSKIAIVRRHGTIGSEVSKQVSYFSPETRRRFFENQFKTSRLRDFSHYGTCRKRNSYSTYPHFTPGEYVYAVVYNQNRTRVSIIRDRIQEVYSFGGKGALKEYWLEKTKFYTGIEAGDIYKTKNEAMFYLCHGGMFSKEQFEYKRYLMGDIA